MGQFPLQTFLGRFSVLLTIYIIYLLMSLFMSQTEHAKRKKNGKKKGTEYPKTVGQLQKV